MSDMVLYHLFHATCILRATLYDYLGRIGLFRRG